LEARRGPPRGGTPGGRDVARFHAAASHISSRPRQRPMQRGRRATICPVRTNGRGAAPSSATAERAPHRRAGEFRALAGVSLARFGAGRRAFPAAPTPPICRCAA
jgi:hypothetical protein